MTIEADRQRAASSLAVLARRRKWLLHQCRQLQRDLESWNDNHPTERIEISFDSLKDLKKEPQT